MTTEAQMFATVLLADENEANWSYEHVHKLVALAYREGKESDTSFAIWRDDPPLYSVAARHYGKGETQ